MFPFPEKSEKIGKDFPLWTLLCTGSILCLKVRRETEMEKASSENASTAPPLWIVDLGRRPYPAAWRLQRALLEARIKENIPDVLLYTEHDPVFTLGRHGGRENLCLSEKTILEKGIPCIRTDRGGDITYHGPGQLVGYPILKIPGHGRNVRAFVDTLEGILMHSLSDFGIRGERADKRTGVWAGKAKIASIGLAVKNGFCFHGFALNVNMDLAPFSWIHPCGLKDAAVTSMGNLLNKPPGLAEVRETVTFHFSLRLRRTPILIPPGEILRKAP